MGNGAYGLRNHGTTGLRKGRTGAVESKAEIGKAEVGGRKTENGGRRPGADSSTRHGWKRSRCGTSERPGRAGESTSGRWRVASRRGCRGNNWTGIGKLSS